MKRTIVLGASPKSYRFSNETVRELIRRGIEVFPVGIRKGTIEGINIIIGKPTLKNIHTITLYLRPELQKLYYDYILSLHPARIIFNPGAENPELNTLAGRQGIEIHNACTIEMLNDGSF